MKTVGGRTTFTGVGGITVPAAKAEGDFLGFQSHWVPAFARTTDIELIRGAFGLGFSGAPLKPQLPVAQNQRG